MTGCSTLAEAVLTRDTPHAVLGESGDELLDYQVWAPAESAQLRKANDDKRTGFAIIRACEVRDDSIRNRPWWRF